MKTLIVKSFFIYVLIGCCSHCLTDDYIHLFNGKDLTGWKATFGIESFQVENGILKANSTGRMPHLLYVGKDGKTKFKNFELIVVSKGGPNSNSGIFFHTSDKLANKKRGYLYDGYEVQLNSTKKEKRETGSLYSIVDLNVSPVDETKWFEIKIRAHGKRIQVWVNDKQVVDYKEPENPERPKRPGRVLKPEGGAIAIQAHDPNSTWYFKEIKIKHIGNELKEEIQKWDT